MFAGYKRDVGVNTAYAALQIPLPLRNRNEGEIARAEAQVRIARASLEETQLAVRADIEAAEESYRREVEIVRDTLPGMRADAKQNLQIESAAYRLGGVDLLRYLDAERTEIDVEVMAIRTLGEFHQAAVSPTACDRRTAMRVRRSMILLLILSAAGCSKKQGGGPDGNSSSTQSASQADGSGSGGSGKAGQGSNGQAEPGTVRIERQDQPKAGIVLAEIEARIMPQVLTVPAQIAMDDAHTSHVGAIASGRVTAVYVLPGQNVRRGMVLAQFHSDSVHETVGALAKAFADADRQRSAVVFALQTADRYSKLYAIQAASLEEKQRAEQELKQAQQSLTDAAADVHMEREHLSELLQVAPETLTPGTLYDRELIPIRSPMDGVVVARNVTVGQVIEAGFDAFDVSNLSTIWVIAAVNEKDLGLIHNGAHASVITQAYPQTVFAASVQRVGDLLDPTTRTIPVRIVARNPDMKLRPGMFASVHIDEPKTRTALFIPEDALQDVNGNQVVFTTGDGETFKAQIVKLGTRTEGKAEVIEGLKPGDHVVVNGAFMVKGELLKGTVGDG